MIVTIDTIKDRVRVDMYDNDFTEVMKDLMNIPDPKGFISFEDRDGYAHYFNISNICHVEAVK